MKGELELVHTGKENNKRKISNYLHTVKQNVIDYMILYLNTSTIHGLRHLVVSERHPYEVLLWLFVVIFCIICSGYLSLSNWMRYQSSPTVISMERDMFAWNTSFPAATLCPDIRFDSFKLNSFLANFDETDKEKLKEFLIALANATFDNFDTIPIYEKIPASKFMNLLLELAMFFRPNLTPGIEGVKLEVMPTITEMGLCFAINSNVAVYNSPMYREENRWDLVNTRYPTLYVHPLNGEVFNHLVNISSSCYVYIHSPSEVPDIATKRSYCATHSYLRIFVTATSIYTSLQASRLTVDQRRCRFIHENNLKHFPVYTYGMCRMECRMRLCLQYCNCIPHFYRPIDGEKVCDVRGLQCLAKYKDILYKLRDKQGKKLQCDCYPICDDVNYVVQTNTALEWIVTSFQYGIKSYPRMRYRRDVIFAFTDFLVAVGGMAGLFLGCSLLSFIEVVYFFTLRLYYTITVVKN